MTAQSLLPTPVHPSRLHHDPTAPEEHGPGRDFPSHCLGLLCDLGLLPSCSRACSLLCVTRGYCLYSGPS